VVHNLPAGNQSSAQISVKTVSQTTNTRITRLSKTVDAEGDFFLFNRKEDGVNYAVTTEIKQRLLFTTQIPQSNPFKSISERAQTLPGIRF
jgi:phosphatidate phosphatase PAH1